MNTTQFSSCFDFMLTEITSFLFICSVSLSLEISRCLDFGFLEAVSTRGNDELN